MELVKIQKKGTVTLPSEVRKSLKLNEGDFLEVKVKEASIIITPQVVVDRSTFKNANSDYTKKQRAKIDKQLKAAGQTPVFGPFKNSKELAKLLKSYQK